MKHFVIMVDNEVVDNAQLPEKGDITSNGQNIPDKFLEVFEKRIAIFSSDPKFMVVDGAKTLGAIWNGTEFVEPS